jgi:hypothetical protein
MVWRSNHHRIYVGVLKEFTVVLIQFRCSDSLTCFCETFLNAKCKSLSLDCIHICSGDYFHSGDAHKIVEQAHGLASYPNET